MHGVKPAPLVAFVLGSMLGCGGSNDVPPIAFGSFGPRSAPPGRGTFRFGTATAAAQIEDMNPSTDWYLWTRPTADGGLGHATFVGEATRGYSPALDDGGLVAALGADS